MAEMEGLKNCFLLVYKLLPKAAWCVLVLKDLQGIRIPRGALCFSQQPRSLRVKSLAQGHPASGDRSGLGETGVTGRWVAQGRGVGSGRA